MRLPLFLYEKDDAFSRDRGEISQGDSLKSALRVKIFFPSSDQRRGAAKELSKDNVSGALELGKKFLLPSPRGWSLDAGTDSPSKKLAARGLVGWLTTEREHR